MPIIYPGGAGFLTGAVVGVIIGLSFQHGVVPVQRMKAVVCMAYDGLDVSLKLRISLSLAVPFVVAYRPRSPKKQG